MRLSELFDFTPGTARFPAADTATFGAAMVKNTIGPIRNTAHRGRVLLYGSGGNEGADANPADGNPTAFKGILANSEAVNMTENTAKVRLHMKYAHSNGYRNENDTLVSADSDEYTTALEPLRAHYSSFTLTGQLMAAAAKGESDFKPAFTESMERTVTSAKSEANRSAFTPSSGVVAVVRATAAAAATVISVDTTIYFRVGEIVDGLTIATGVVIEPARTVTAVDRVNRTLTVSPALTTGLTLTTTGFVRASSNSTVAVPNDSFGRETTGLADMIAASGTLHGITPALYPTWASYVQTGAGPVSEDILRLAKDSVGFETGLDEGGDMDFVLITTRGVRSNFAATQLPLKRYNDTQKLEGGFDVIMFDGAPIFVDDHCQVGTLYGLRVSRMLWAMLKDWSWMDSDGAVLSRVPGKDQYQAILYCYHALMTTQRAAHFSISGLTDTIR